METLQKELHSFLFFTCYIQNDGAR